MGLRTIATEAASCSARGADVCTSCADVLGLAVGLNGTGCPAPFPDVYAAISASANATQGVCVLDASTAASQADATQTGTATVTALGALANAAAANDETAILAAIEDLLSLYVPEEDLPGYMDSVTTVVQSILSRTE